MDVRDIAAVAAIALTESGHEGATFTLTGPASITHGEIAAALTSALGRDITFIDVPPGAFADSLQGILPPWQIQGLLEDYSHYRRGEAASVPRQSLRSLASPRQTSGTSPATMSAYSSAEPRRRVPAESPAAAEISRPT